MIHIPTNEVDMGFYHPQPTIHGFYNPRPTIHGLQSTAFNPRPEIHGLQSTAFNPRPTIHGLQSTAYNPRLTIHGLLLLSFHRCHLRHLRYLIPESVDRCGQVDMNSLTRANTRAFTRTGYSFSLKNIYFCAIKNKLSSCLKTSRFCLNYSTFPLDNFR